jgi:transposase-like protein
VAGSKTLRYEDDREGQFHTQAFDRYSRYEPHIAEGLTQMFVAGTSTHKGRERGEVQAELVGSWDQPSKQEALTALGAFKAKYAHRYPEAVRSLAEDEEHLSAFYACPAAMHRHIQTTNAIESLFSNVRQRTDQIDVFTTETSCLAIVWATIQDIRLHKLAV